MIMPSAPLELPSSVKLDGVDDEDDASDTLRLPGLRSGIDSCAGMAAGGRIGVPGAAPDNERIEARDKERRKL